MCDDSAKELKPLGLTSEKVQVLCVRLQDQAELLRFMTRLDVGFFTGVSTALAIISAWVLGQESFPVEIGAVVAAFEFVIFVVYFLFISLNQLRRKEAIETIRNTNEALKLNNPDFYISGKSINAAAQTRLWGVYYKSAGFVFFLGSILVIVLRMGILETGRSFFC